MEPPRSTFARCAAFVKQRAGASLVVLAGCCEEGRSMRRLVGLLALLAMSGAASGVLPPGLTPDEAACERAFGPATDGFGAAIATCVVRCDAKAARGKLARSECVAPYGSATRACIERARAVEARRIAHGCRADCPECYGHGDCGAFGRDALLVTGQVVDGLVRRVLCDDASSVDGLSPAEDRCRRAAGAALARAARAFGRCFVRCRQRVERIDDTPVVPCTSAGPVQIDSVAICLARVRRLALGAIDRRCANPPECLDPTTLVDVVAEQIRSDYDVLIFCASPSGVFVGE
jgi:hypothetical protein